MEKSQCRLSIHITFQCTEDREEDKLSAHFLLSSLLHCLNEWPLCFCRSVFAIIHCAMRAALLQYTEDQTHDIILFILHHSLPQQLVNRTFWYMYFPISTVSGNWAQTRGVGLEFGLILSLLLV